MSTKTNRGQHREIKKDRLFKENARANARESPQFVGSEKPEYWIPRSVGLENQPALGIDASADGPTPDRGRSNHVANSGSRQCWRKSSPQLPDPAAQRDIGLLSVDQWTRVSWIRRCRRRLAHAFVLLAPASLKPSYRRSMGRLSPCDQACAEKRNTHSLNARAIGRSSLSNMVTARFQNGKKNRTL